MINCKTLQENEIDALRSAYRECFRAEQKPEISFFLKVVGRGTKSFVVLHIGFPSGYPQKEQAKVDYRCKNLQSSKETQVKQIISQEVSKLGSPVTFNIANRISTLLSQKEESLYDEMVQSLRGAITSDHISYDKCGSLKKLPLDAILYIFSFADFATLAKLSRACRQLNYLIEHSQLWQHIAYTLFPFAKKKRLNLEPVQWKEFVRKERTIQHNLRHSIYTVTPLQLNTPIRPQLLDFDTEIIIVACDTCILFWVLGTDTLYARYELDNETIDDIQLFGEYLLTAGSNGLVLRTKYSGDVVQVIDEAPYRSCRISNDYIVGFNVDGKINIFDKTPTLLQTVIVDVQNQHNKRLVLDGDNLVYHNANDIVSLNLSFNKSKVLLSTKDVILDFDCSNSSVRWVTGDNTHFTIREGTWEYTDNNFKFIKSINYDDSRYIIGLEQDPYATQKGLMWMVGDLKDHYRTPLLVRSYGATILLCAKGPYIVLVGYELYLIDYSGQ